MASYPSTNESSFQQTFSNLKAHPFLEMGKMVKDALLPGLGGRREERAPDLESIKLAMAGLGDATKIGKSIGIEPDVPAMSMIGGEEGTAEGQPVQDYGEKVRSALTESLAPGFSTKQLQRDALGLPMETPAEKFQREQGEGSQKFESRAKEAFAGTISFDQLKAEFPTKIDAITKMQAQTPGATAPVQRNPNFKVGTGGWISQIKSKFSPNQAELDDTTSKVIQNIGNEADLEEFLKDAALYQAQGVDVKAVKEYFGR